MIVETLHRLFFAIKPAAAAIPAIKAAQRLHCPGEPIRDDHLYITMEILDDLDRMPEAQAAKLLAIGDDIDMPGFLLPLSRVIGTTRSVALRPKGRSTGLSLLQQAIHERVVAAGLTVREGWSFSPHMTLGYRDGTSAARSIDTIAWQVEELVLVHSHVGQTRHDTIGAWPLAPELPLFQ